MTKGYAYLSSRHKEESALFLRDSDSPQLLALVSTMREATLIVRSLDGFGIRADRLRASGIDAPGLIQIRVRQADFHTAREALAHLRQLIKVESDGEA